MSTIVAFVVTIFSLFPPPPLRSSVRPAPLSLLFLHCLFCFFFFIFSLNPSCYLLLSGTHAPIYECNQQQVCQLHGGPLLSSASSEPRSVRFFALLQRLCFPGHWLLAFGARDQRPQPGRSRRSHARYGQAPCRMLQASLKQGKNDFAMYSKETGGYTLSFSS